jgi:sarcosine oxidase subunit beta
VKIIRNPTMTTTRGADVVVVGAGIIGAATAYYLARAGVDVLLLDRGGPSASGGATQACAGGVRQQGRVACEIPLAIRAVRLWEKLGSELEADLHYRQDGMFVVTDDPQHVATLEHRVQQEQSRGLAVHMVYGEDLHRQVPGLSPRMLAGSSCPTDGHADPLSTVAAFCSAAARLGARMRWFCPAIGFLIENGRIAAVKTNGGPIPCKQIVLAAGIWSRPLAQTFGLSLPLQAATLQMMVTARRPHRLDPVLGWLGHGLSLKQVPSGGFVIGGGWPGRCELSSGRTQLLPGAIAKSAATALGIYPGIAGVPVVRAWAGIEAFSSDEMQLLGPVPEIEGLMLATGFSGHGFGIGPAVGEQTAAWITTGRMLELLRPYIIERFDRTSGGNDS